MITLSFFLKTVDNLAGTTKIAVGEEGTRAHFKFSSKVKRWEANFIARKLHHN